VILGDPLFYARALHFAATLLVAGVTIFLVSVAEPAFRKAGADAAAAAVVRHRLNWIAWASLALAVISGAAWLVLTAEAMSQQSLTVVLSQGVLWTVLAETTFGNAWLARFVLACLLAVLFAPALAQRRIKSRPLQAALIIFAAAFAGSLAWAGHAAGGLGLEAIIHQPADVLHLIAASAWVGALIPLVVLLQAAGQEETLIASARTATFRFSTLGIAAVGTLLVTGSINSWYLVGSVAALTGTDYGRLLLVKIVLFVVMVAIAGFNLLRLTPRVARRDNLDTARRALRQLRQNAAIETAAGAVIVAIVAVLGTLPPASHAGHQHSAYSSAVPPDAAFVHIHSDQGMAEVTILPGRAGAASATIHLWDDDFNVIPAHALTLTLTPPAPGSKPMTRSAVQDPDAAWHVDGIELSQPGNWTVTVSTVLGSGKPLVLEAPIVIEGKQ
jgi:putative copper resistance protein D